MAMIFSNPSVTLNVATVAQFVAWGQAISNAIAAVGLTKTTDTGQVDWATLSALPAAVGYGSASSDYEVWQFTDSLQASAPIFIRLDYGICTSLTSAYLSMVVGSATNGAGVIQGSASFPGALSARLNLTSSNMPAAGPSGVLTVASDGGGTLFIGGLVSSVNYTGLFGLVERTRDFTGAAESSGALAMTMSTPGVWDSQSLPYSSAFQSAGTFPYGLVPTGGSVSVTPPHTGIESNKVYTYPFFTGFVPHVGGPSGHLVGVWEYDLPIGNQFALTHYGVATTFQATGTMGTSAGLEGNSVNATSMSVAYRVA